MPLKAGRFESLDMSVPVIGLFIGACVLAKEGLTYEAVGAIGAGVAAVGLIANRPHDGGPLPRVPATVPLPFIKPRSGNEVTGRPSQRLAGRRKLRA